MSRLINNGFIIVLSISLILLGGLVDRVYAYDNYSIYNDEEYINLTKNIIKQTRGYSGHNVELQIYDNYMDIMLEVTARNRIRYYDKPIIINNFYVLQSINNTANIKTFSDAYQANDYQRYAYKKFRLEHNRRLSHVTNRILPKNHPWIEYISGDARNNEKDQGTTEELQNTEWKLYKDSPSHNPVSILIEGEISTNLYDALDTMLYKFRRSVKNVYLDSAGGFSNPSEQIGELIKKYKLNTVLKQGGQCASGCTIIFAYGRHRVAPKNNNGFIFHGSICSVLLNQEECSEGKNHVRDLYMKAHRIAGTNDNFAKHLASLPERPYKRINNQTLLQNKYLTKIVK